MWAPLFLLSCCVHNDTQNRRVAKRQGGCKVKVGAERSKHNCTYTVWALHWCSQLPMYWLARTHSNLVCMCLSTGSSPFIHLTFTHTMKDLRLVATLPLRCNIVNTNRRIKDRPGNMATYMATCMNIYCALMFCYYIGIGKLCWHKFKYNRYLLA